MNIARIIIGANYGDEGKGTVTAHYAKHNDNVLNILTNGGAQRGHSIVSEFGSHTFQHFGSGTYYGAANYYSRFFILNPMQFTKEYHELIVKPTEIYRHTCCRWSTPYDMMANAITEEIQKRHASCGMGIWNTIKRYCNSDTMIFDRFIKIPFDLQSKYLNTIKSYYENMIDIPQKWESIWNSETLVLNFIEDCKFMYEKTKPIVCESIFPNLYENLLFENGQGLLLTDTGKDTYDTTPSNTGLAYSLTILQEMGIIDNNNNPKNNSQITAHYVTRPYQTRHGDGKMENELSMSTLSNSVKNDRTNVYNQFQGDFRYGMLDIDKLKERIERNANSIPYEIELTHCDEMDRSTEFNKSFTKVNIYDTPNIK